MPQALLVTRSIASACRRAVARRRNSLARAARSRPARSLQARAGSETGMSTAEYAIGTIAACAFAALLYKVVTSSQIFDLLTGLVSRALHVPF
jgi:hypothetical protein